jgi:hypothetical protein
MSGRLDWEVLNIPTAVMPTIVIPTTNNLLQLYRPGRNYLEQGVTGKARDEVAL